MLFLFFSPGFQSVHSVLSFLCGHCIRVGNLQVCKRGTKGTQKTFHFLWVTHADSFRTFCSQGTLFAKEFEVIFLLVIFYFDTEMISVKSVSQSEL